MFRRRKRPVESPTSSAGPTEVYTGLRNQILTLDPSTVGLPATSSSTWACLMETGYSSGTATLVCLSDGTTSLYTSSGFGVIGGGGHKAVRGANAALLTTLGRHLADMSPSTDQSLPSEGRTVIRALTAEGQRTYEAAEDELGEGRSALSPVFYAAQAVITQLRLIDGAR